jgi:hypothetical protein
VIIKPDYVHWQMAFSGFPGDLFDLYEDYAGCLDPWSFQLYGIPALIRDYEEALQSCNCGTKRKRKSLNMCTRFVKVGERRKIQ